MLVSAKSAEDGTRGMGEEGSSFAPLEVGRGAQNSRWESGVETQQSR